MPHIPLLYSRLGKPIWMSASLYVIFALWKEWLHNHIRAQEQYPASSAAPRLLFVEAIKLFLSLAFSFWRLRSASRASRHTNRQYTNENEAYLAGDAGDTIERLLESQAHGNRCSLTDVVLSTSTFRTSIAYAVLTSALFAFYNYNVLIAQQITDPFTLYLTLSLGTLITLCISHIILAKVSPIVQWHAAIIQSCGFLVIQASLKILPHPSYPILISSAISYSLSYVVLDHIYTVLSDSSLYMLHNVLFASGVIIHTIILLTQRADPYSAPSLRAVAQPSFTELVLCFAQAATDMASLVVTYHLGAAAEGILSSTSIAISVVLLSAKAESATIHVVAGCFLVISASIIYLSHHPDAEEEQRHVKRLAFPFRRMVSGVLLLGSVFYLAFTTRQWRVVRDVPSKPVTVMDALSTAASTCVRKPLASISFWPSERTYHAFDDVLLIVFFSHARYDANLDYYRDVYSQFFPNIIFVGPGNREDAGFAHSYDVLVDSYQSDEDLIDQSFYKMAGRMAHHMLYTALKEYDCYDGYLWAPFDTLLNIPRLQLFDQQYFWYHSPFGQYVPNAALGNAEANANSSRHAPPANVSPDPSVNLTATWRGWGADWWWGDPRVGLAVCMQAFDKVPVSLRENLSTHTNGTTRLIGGSADTLYIPGRHRQVFMDTLALFLETDCFLEIATPTVVHLVAPPNEPILYVDHWWIWQPPFNSTYVRQMWAEGYEVDTFHTFHWGDRDSDGIWRGNPEHITDVRNLFAESAYRQGIEFPTQHRDSVT